MSLENNALSVKDRLQNLSINPIKGGFDVAHLQAIHAYLFQDFPNLKPGIFRQEARGDWFKQREMFQATEKGIAPWISYSHMDKASQEKLSEILKSADPSALSKLNKEQFVKEMASLYANLDYIHPFLEGNSRTLRIFTAQLSKESGFDLRWKNFDRLKDREQNRELLYIARDKAIYDISLQNIKTANIREYVQGSQDYFKDKDYPTLENMIGSITTAKDWHLNRNIEHLLSRSQNQPLPSPALSNSKEESAQAMPSASTSKPSISSDKKQSFAEEFASKIIEQLEAGTAPWVKPFEAGELNFPYNGKTEDRYRGSNILRLVMENRSDPRWMTYKQAQEMGGQVRKGEKATRLLRMVYDKEVLKKDENGKIVKGEDGKALKERVKLDRPFASSFVVFNAEQIDGLPELERPEPDLEKEFKANQRAEAMLKASNAEIEHKNSGRAFYSPQEDKITLPEKSLFHSESGYYSTALHELGHWTGHENRLNRDLKHPFGSMGYAKEELRAEIASMMLAMELGTGFDPGNHAAYIQSWVKILKDTPEEIITATRDADKIKDFVMSFDKEIEQEITQEAFQSASLEIKDAAISLYNERHSLTGDNEVQLDDDGEISIAGGSDNDFDKIYSELEKIALDLQQPTSSQEAQKGSDAKPFISSVKDLGQDHFEILAEDILHYTKDFSESEEASADSLKGKLLDAAASDFITLDKSLAHFELDTGDKYQAVQKFAQEYETEFKKAANQWIEDKSGLIPQIYDLNAMKEGLRNLNLADEADYISAEISAAQAPLASKQGKEFKGVEVSIPFENQAENMPKEPKISGKPVYINVPYMERKEAKEAGAQWSAKEKSWFIPAGKDQNDFDKWQKNDLLNRPPQADKIYLAVPASDVSEVKKRGAQFDEEKKAWFIDTTKKFDSSLEQWSLNTVATIADSSKSKASSEQLEKPASFAQKRLLNNIFNDLGREAAIYNERSGYAQGEATKQEKDELAYYKNLEKDFEKANQSLDTLSAKGASEIIKNFKDKRLTELKESGLDGFAINPSQQLKETKKTVSKQERPAPSITKEESLAEKLRELGLQVPDTLHFDGKGRNIPAIGQKGSQKSGFYAAWENNGRPAGTIVNHKTGIAETWTYEGNTRLSKAEIEAQKIVMAQRQKDREEKKAQKEKEVAQAVLSEFQNSLKTIRKPTAYMVKKQIHLTTAPAQKEREKEPELAHLYIKTDAKKNTIVPMVDATGKLWNKQTITKDGSKYFEKDAKKQGCFFPLGTIDSFENASAIVIAEGLATTASLQEVAKDTPATANNKLYTMSFVAAFDSGNLKPVAEAIREKYPDKPILIAADDDRHCLLTNGHNIGKEKAEEAAKAVGSRVMSPVFNEKTDKTWPQDVPKFTPTEYKAGKVSQEQLDALKAYKKLTDFNDLATKTEFGKDIIRSQLNGEMAVLRGKQEKTKAFEKTLTQTKQPEQINAPKALTPSPLKAKSRGFER